MSSDLDAAVRLEAARIHDALVRDRPLLALVEHRVRLLETLGDVVRVEDRDLRGQREPCPAHHHDVHGRDGQHARASHGAAGDRADGVLAAGLHDRVAGKERREVLRDADRPTPDRRRRAGSRTSCAGSGGRRRRRCRRAAEADHGVHVGAVEIHLPPYWWIVFVMSVIASSNTPCVDGYVTMSAASLLACCSAARLPGRRRRCCRSGPSSRRRPRSRHDRARRVRAVRPTAGSGRCCGDLRSATADAWDDQQPAYAPGSRRWAAASTAWPVISAKALLGVLRTREAFACRPARTDAVRRSGPRHGHRPTALSFIVQRPQRDHRVRQRQVAALERWM